MGIEKTDQNELAKDLILIQHAHYQPWISVLYKGPIQTWLKNPPSNIYYFFGKAQNTKVRKLDMIFWNLKWNKNVGRAFLFLEYLFHKLMNRYRPGIKLGFLPNSEIKAFKLEMPDLNLLYAHKTINTLEFALTLPWERLVMVTSSSYINLKALDELLSDLPNRKLIAGKILHQQANHFPSGSFRIFSRDVVEQLVKTRSKYRLYLPEDLALGKLASTFDLPMIELSSIDLPDLETLESLSQEDLERTPHFRCKSGTHENRDDVEIILRLHERLTT